MYRFPYRRAFKSSGGSTMIELLDGTVVAYADWKDNPVRVIETREYDENLGYLDPAPEPDFEEPR